MRSIWNGALTFGLVNVPVKVHAATEDHDVSFHQVHDADCGQIRYQRVCEVCGQQVDYQDVAKAYESEDHQRVIITEEDLKSLPEEASHEIEVLEFVPAEQIEPIMYDKSYYLEPDGKSIKAYVLLRTTLAATDRVAIVHFALRNKTRLGALRVRDKALMVQTLIWPDEIRPPEFESLDTDAGPARAPKISDAELKLASHLVESMTNDFHPARFTDTYQEQLHDLIEAKLAQGESYSPVEIEASADAEQETSDLLAALEASLAAQQEGGRANGTRKEPTPGRRK
jgi:DNA end-binding protein Ku